ncbi:hypothetical protein Tco_1501719 [Tanacetum coccineum]
MRLELMGYGWGVVLGRGDKEDVGVERHRERGMRWMCVMNMGFVETGRDRLNVTLLVVGGELEWWGVVVGVGWVVGDVGWEGDGGVIKGVERVREGGVVGMREKEEGEWEVVGWVGGLMNGTILDEVASGVSSSSNCMTRSSPFKATVACPFCFLGRVGSLVSHLAGAILSLSRQVGADHPFPKALEKWSNEINHDFTMESAVDPFVGWWSQMWTRSLRCWFRHS